ncbi:MAG: hypothetical protein S4CHLAM7_02950 [Chlamydiae bacterium]|nr:hypothetical protein [Chlamydiota bacterium]
MIYPRLLLLFFFLSSSFYVSAYGLLQGQSRARHDQEERSFMEDIYHTYSPFYTGPLLAPSAHTVPKGKVNVQPYFFWQKNYGAYDRNWKQQHTRSSMSMQYLAVFQYGLTNFMDISVIAQSWFKRSLDESSFNYGDMSATVGFQLLDDFLHTAWPACVVEIGVNIPTGRFEKLDATKNGTDSSGTGSYTPTISLNFQKSFNRLFKKSLDPLDYHPFLFRWSFGYDLVPRTKVQGVNTYGGANNTNGFVNPGDTFISIFAWEYSITEQWVFATDWQYEATRKTTFSGHDGGSPVGGPASQNWSVAPAIEFNANPNFGALAGVWVTLGGRNSTQFVSGIVSFTWLF